MPTPGTSVIGLGRERSADAPNEDAREFGAQPVEPSNAPSSRQRMAPRLRVMVESPAESGQFSPLDEVTTWTIARGLDGADTLLNLTVGLDTTRVPSGASGTIDFANLLARLNPNARVRVTQVQGAFGERLWFDGYAITTTMQWGGAQGLSVACLSAGQDALRTHPACQITGRLMRYSPLTEWRPEAPDAKTVETLPAVFNAAGKPNRSAERFPVTVNGRTHEVHVFVEDDAPGAKPWTVAQALRYLAAWHIRAAHLNGVDTGVSAAELLVDTDELIGDEALTLSAGLASDPFAARMTARLASTAVNAMHVEDAIKAVCGRAGLHFETRVRSNPPGHFLRVTATPTEDMNASNPERAMIAAQAHDLPRETPWVDPSTRTDRELALNNRGYQATITVDHRVVNRPTFLAGPREYEVTLLLRPGWPPNWYELLERDPDDPAEAADPNERLDSLVTEQQVLDAAEFWKERFEDDLDERDGLPPTIYHGAHPKHWKVADVGRLWVFPDDHRYVLYPPGATDSGQYESPYARTGWPKELYSPYNPDRIDQTAYARATIGGGVADAKDWLPRRRPMGNTIGRLLNASTRPPIIMLNFRATSAETALADPSWVQYAGGQHILDERCGLLITEQNLWNTLPMLEDRADPDGMNYIKAHLGLDDADEYVGPHLFVAVTCTVRGDRRLAYTSRFGSPVSRDRSGVIELGERFAFRNRRGNNSFLNGNAVDDDPAFEGRDDFAALREYGDGEGLALSKPRVAGPITIFWPDDTYELGDALSGASGLGLSFDLWPEIVAIEHRYDAKAGYQTTLHLTDLREAPEVGDA